MNAKSMPEGMGWRVGVTILGFFGMIIAVVLWLFFFAASYNVYQNIAVLITIGLSFIATMAAIWASWGLRQAQMCDLA